MKHAWLYAALIFAVGMIIGGLLHTALEPDVQVWRSESTNMINRTVVHNYSQTYNHSTYWGADWTFIEPSKQCENRRAQEIEYQPFWGTSMLPTLLPDTQLITVPYDARRGISEGEILGVQTLGGVVVHRVCGVYKDHFRLCPDRRDMPGDPYAYDESQIRFVVCGSWYGQKKPT